MEQNRKPKNRPMLTASIDLYFWSVEKWGFKRKGQDLGCECLYNTIQAVECPQIWQIFKCRLFFPTGVLLCILMGIYHLHFLEVRNVSSRIPDLRSTAQSLDLVFKSTQTPYPGNTLSPCSGLWGRFSFMILASESLHVPSTSHLILSSLVWCEVLQLCFCTCPALGAAPGSLLLLVFLSICK